LTLIQTEPLPLFGVAFFEFEVTLALMQPETSERSWSPASQVILGADPQLVLYGDIVLWFHKVELFRQHQQQRMYLRSPGPEDLALHKKLLQRLIADGEHLIRLMAQHGFVANSDAVTPGDVAASVRSLSADFRGWHEPMPEARREEILHQVFDVSQSAH
jgi:hypothetical protein